MSNTNINNMKKILGVGAAVSLGATVLPLTSIAAPNDGSLDLAQAQTPQAAACRQVDASPGLNVRAQPGGEVIGSVEENNFVYLQNPNPQGQDWVEIQAPMNGYVAATYLNFCTEAAAQQQPIARIDAQQEPISQQPGQINQPGQMQQPMDQPLNQPGQMQQPMDQPLNQPGQMQQPMDQPLNQPGQMQQPMDQPLNQPGQMQQPMDQPLNQPGQMQQPMDQPLNQPGQMTQPGQIDQSMNQMEGESCRSISAETGLNVRSQPEVGSAVLTTLPDNSQVQIQNRGEDGWVPISEPVQGYVAAENLMMCGQ